MGTGLVMPRLPHVGQANCNIVGGVTQGGQKTFVYRGGYRWQFTTCIMSELQQCDWAFQHHQTTEKKSFWRMSLWRKKRY
jgi:hypothetical protein